MNKSYLFIYIFLFAFSLNASSAIDTTIVFSTKTRLNMGQKHTIKITQNGLFFNAEKIDPLQLPTLLPDLQNLSQVKKVPLIDCTSGTYTHTVTKNKKTEKFTGCLSSDTAQKILKSIDQLKKAKLL